MERLDSDLLIVSAFGRGNWLASEAASRGWKVTLIDVSESLGTFAPEDVEGPFGLLEASDLTLSQKNRLDEEGETVRVPGGLTLWLKDGPLEFRGELTQYLLGQKGIPLEVDEYLRDNGLPGKESIRARRVLQKKSFREAWLAHFCHQVASVEVHENHVSLDSGDHWPVFAPFSVRQVTNAGLQKGLKALQTQGVNVRARARIRELTLGSDQSTTIEVQDGNSQAEVEKGRALVWMLSSLESRTCPPSVAEALYPKGAIEPDWYWSRLEFQLDGLPDDQIPLHAIAVEDPFLPWSHANVLVLRKSREARGLDVWIKLPLHFQSQAARFAGMTDEVRDILARRFPGSQVKLSSQQDPSRVSRMVRQPLFESATLERLQTRRLGHLFFCGPEQWEFSDWLGAYRPQNLLFQRLVSMKSQWDASDAKAAAREAARVAREKARTNRSQQ